jgi:hypothetical protein
LHMSQEERDRTLAKCSSGSGLLSKLR